MYSRRRFVPTYGRDEVASGPEMLTHEIALPLPVDLSQMDCALALDKADHLRNRVLRWDRDHHVNMIRHEVTLFDPALLLQGQLAEHISEMLPQFPIKYLPAVLGNEHHVVFDTPISCGLGSHNRPS